MLGKQHERRFFVTFKYFARPFGENDRGKRPERLPELHPVVQNIFHFGLARVGQDAAIAERARPEFGTPLKPTDHIALRKHLRRFGAMFLLGVVIVSRRTSHLSIASWTSSSLYSTPR